jgi:DNA replicative helicase MCM subunit Mcm2 (Cdc46/Mcm family)
MEHHNILRFLFLRGLITILLIGGLGVEDQQNGFREVSVSTLLTYFCRVAQKGIYRSKPRNQCDIDFDVNITSVSL